MAEEKDLIIYEAMLNTSVNNKWLDMPLIMPDTAARILAVLYHYGGGNEVLTFCKKFNLERLYIQKYYGIDGGETLDASVAMLLKKYVNQLEEAKKPPSWVIDIFQKRYGITLHL